MKTQELIVGISEILLNEKSLSPQQAAKHLGAPILQVYKALKQLDDVVEVSENESGKLYTLTDEAKLKSLLDTKEEPKSKSPEKKPKTTSTRDTSKYVFEKVTYAKGACCRAVVAAVVRDKDPTLAQLREIFPNEIVARFGVVNTIKEARKLSVNNRDRYFFKDEHILTTKDKKKIVVTNQWTLDRFLIFLSAARKAGYKVKAE